MIPGVTTKHTIYSLFDLIKEAILKNDEFALMDAILLIEPQIAAYIVSVLKANNFYNDSEYYETIFETCKHECKLVVLKKAKENIDIDITKYLSGVIINVYKSTLRYEMKPTNNGISFISLDAKVGDGNMTNSEIYTKSNEVSDFMDFILELEIKQNKTKVEEWILLIVVEGFKQKEVAEMYGVSPAYVCKQIKKYCSKIIESF